VIVSCETCEDQHGSSAGCISGERQLVAARQPDEAARVDARAHRPSAPAGAALNEPGVQGRLRSVAQERAGGRIPAGQPSAADIVLSWRSKSAADAERVAAAIGELEDLASALAATRTDPFNPSAAADRLLLTVLLRRNLNEATRKEIAQAFTTALSRGASAKILDSMRTQFRFYRRLMETEFPKDRRAAMQQQLTLLEKKLVQ
jgi:hypothetical protein